MRILITGGAGFIGSHLADALLDQGHEVTVIDDLSTGRRENVPDGAAFIFGDIREADHIASMLGDVRPDVIYHCAASYRDRDDWERDAETNVLGTINVVREAIRCRSKLVYFQTSLCYGMAPASPVTIDAPLDPHGSYAVTKTAGEAFIRDSGVEYVSLRLANMYGPRNLSGPVPTFYKRLTEGQPCTVVDSRRDFVFIDDLVRVAVKAATQGSGVYHVASGGDEAVSSVYSAVRSALDLDAPDPAVVPRGPDDVATILLDPSLTEEEFGWRTEGSLLPGVRRAVAWYREHGVKETYTHLSVKG